MIIWDTESYEIIGKFFISPNICIICMSIYENKLYLGSNYGHLSIWNLENKHLKVKNPENYSDDEWLILADRSFINQDINCTSMAFQDNKMFCGCSNGFIYIRCLETNERVLTNFIMDHDDGRSRFGYDDCRNNVTTLIIKDNKLYSSSRFVISAWNI